MTAYIYTLGCKVNQYESLVIRELLESHGFLLLDSPYGADVIIINSCTVTESADTKLRQLMMRIKRESRDSVIALTGCFPQAQPDSIINSYADIVLGENKKTEVVSAIKEYFESGSRLCLVEKNHRGEELEHMLLTSDPEHTRASIKIQDGCDRFCSYCIIPYARGRSRSKPLDVIKDEARGLVAAGHKELVLVGINLSCYGLDLPGGVNLADAASLVCSTSGARRVRLGSLEPELLDKGIIKRLSKNKTLCPHFHLSLQSGSDRVLSEMGRKYDTREYISIVESLREGFEGCTITTDLMTGFPGETREDFADSLRLIEKIGFARVHVFPYSQRPGTRASRRSDGIPRSVAVERAKIASQTAKRVELQFLDSLIGSTQEVLFEREQNPSWHFGHTRGYLEVRVRRTGGSLRHEIKDVIITSREDGFLIGELIKP